MKSVYEIFSDINTCKVGMDELMPRYSLVINQLLSYSQGGGDVKNDMSGSQFKIIQCSIAEIMEMIAVEHNTEVKNIINSQTKNGARHQWHLFRVSQNFLVHTGYIVTV